MDHKYVIYYDFPNFGIHPWKANYEYKINKLDQNCDRNPGKVSQLDGLYLSYILYFLLRMFIGILEESWFDRACKI